MRLPAIAAAFMLLTAAAEAGVERVTLPPGESAAFTLAQGYSHQLLVPSSVERPAAKAIVVRYRLEGGESVVTLVSHAGYPTSCAVLADPDGNGGYSAVGRIDIPGDGTPVERRWPGALGKINIGNFEGGPQGGAPRPKPSP